MTGEEAEYSKRLFDAVLEIVVTLNPDQSGAGGFVDPHIVRGTLVDVAAAVDMNCGLGRLPSERRKTGEEMGKRYAALLKSMLDSGLDRSWPQAVIANPDDKPN